MKISCPACGHQATAEVTACPNCGHAMQNGTVQPPKGPYQKPPPPPEVANWIIEKVPQEVIKQVLGPFNEEEFLTALQEIEETGGYQLEDFIEELREETRCRC